LDIKEVDADDISTLQYQHTSRADDVKNRHDGRCGVPHPLSRVTNADAISTSELENLSGASIVKKLNGSRTRVLHPLSKIMTLVDLRVQKAWATMTPPYVPRQSRRAPNPQERKWPPHYFWKAEFENEWGEQKEMDLQKVINRNYESINRRLKALGLEDLIRETPTSSYETNTRDISSAAEGDGASDGSPPSRKNKKERDGLCVTCGTLAKNTPKKSLDR
jgi:hypothetical protein